MNNCHLWIEVLTTVKIKFVFYNMKHCLIFHLKKIIAESLKKKIRFLPGTNVAWVIALFINTFSMNCRTCIFPREPPFEPKPSLYPVCEYLIEQCIKRYAKEKCPLCNERVLPQNPEVRFYRLLYWVLLKSYVCLGWLLHKL